MDQRFLDRNSREFFTHAERTEKRLEFLGIGLVTAMIGEFGSYSESPTEGFLCQELTRIAP